MNINVRYQPRTRIITVNRMGYLESQTRIFIDNLHFAQKIDRVLLNRGRVVWIGSSELTHKQEVASWLKQVNIRAPF